MFVFPFPGTLAQATVGGLRGQGTTSQIWLPSENAIVFRCPRSFCHHFPRMLSVDHTIAHLSACLASAPNSWGYVHSLDHGGSVRTQHSLATLVISVASYTSIVELVKSFCLDHTWYPNATYSDFSTF